MQKGQVTVLVILLGLMGVLVSLSVASRSLSDLRQATYVDSGTRAYGAAEACLQFALYKLSGQQYGPGNCNFTITGVESMEYNVAQSNSDYLTQTVLQDTVLGLDFTNPTTPSNMDSISVLWKEENVAMEVIVAADNTLMRYVAKGSGLVPDNPSIEPAKPASECARSNCQVSGYNFCIPDVSNIRQAKVARIKPLYGNADVLVCAGTNGNSPGRLDGQLYDITVKATTNDNTVKRLQVSYRPPAMPGVFDYAIYSQGPIVKE